MKLFITGAGGFIGQHLCAELGSMQHEVIVLSREDTIPFWSEFRNFKLVKGDLRETRSWKKELQGADVLIHLASELQQTALMQEVNHLATKNLAVEAAGAGIKKFIHLSSVGVTGASFSAERVLISEHTACHPGNAYEISKWQGEQAVRAVFTSGSIVLRPTNVFGDHHPRHALLNFLKRISAGRWIPCSPDAMVNYVYAGDVARTIIHALRTPAFPEIMQVGTPNSLVEFIKSTAGLLETEPKITRLPASVIRFAACLMPDGKAALLRSLSNRVVYDDQKWKETCPSIYGNFEGLRRTIQWYKKENLL